MSNAIFQVPIPKNEKVLAYQPGSPEKKAVKAALKKMKSKEIDIPMTINGKKVKTKKAESIPREQHISLLLSII